MSFDDLTDNTKSVRNIPGAKFIERITEFLQNKNEENILSQARELLLKYKFMEHAFVTRQINTQKKIPELKDALRVVQFLQKRKQMKERKNLETYFPLEESLYAKGIIQKTDKILLWLGANVMVEFPFDEATDLLNQHLERAINLSKEMDKELLWLHEQITTTEINISRIHNYVEMKKGMNGKEVDKKTEQVN
ncbi:prefoldin subunit 3, putative [Plasmodium sp. DRC-Itaito]|nr:prefoldin subunit 3, putative [Plasmodium sp. DRC-Itaito]